jgi:hypothetical protein
MIPVGPDRSMPVDVWAAWDMTPKWDGRCHLDVVKRVVKALGVYKLVGDIESS